MKKKFTTTLDENVLKKLKIKAVTGGNSVSDLIEKLVELYLDKI